MDKTDFTKPQRQSLFGILFFLLFSIRKSVTAFWPLLVLYLFKGDGNSLLKTYGYLTLITYVIFLIIHSYFTYRHFFFYIENNEFILKKGYLKKVTIAIPLDKIVSINLNQNLLQQIIGVVELEIDSVGSKTKEIKISALRKSVAADLDHLLSVNKKNIEEEEGSDNKPDVEINSTVFKYKIADLIRVGLTRNHLRGLAIVFAFGFNILHQVEDLFKNQIESAAKQTEAFIANSDIAIYISLGFFLIFISFVISMIETILFYFNLTLKKSEKAFTLTSGLLKRKNITIPFSRIQAFRQSINPLQKLAGISTISLSQANSSENSRKKEKVNIPGCNKIVSAKTRNSVFGENGFERFETLRPHHVFLRRRVIFGAIIPAAVSLLLLFISYWFVLLSVSIILFGLWVSWLSWIKRSYELNTQFLKVNHGSFAKKLTIIEYFKAQGITIKQSLFQRFRDTATINVIMAGTSVSINEIAMGQAIEIKDYMLYTIENSKENWM